MSFKKVQRARSFAEARGDVCQENPTDSERANISVYDKYNLDKKKECEVVSEQIQQNTDEILEEKKEVNEENPNSGPTMRLQTINNRTTIKRGGMLFPEDIPTEKYIREKREMMPQIKKKILKTLESHFIFSNLTAAQIEESVLPQLFSCRVEKGQYIFKQGDNGYIFFVIEEGLMSIEIGGEKKKEIGDGDNFGEMAILYNSPRSASIQALEHTKLWGLDRGTFKRIIAETIIKQYSMTRRFIDTVFFFERLDLEQKDAIASALIPHNFSEGEEIIRQGDSADSFYIIKEGSCHIYDGTKKVRELDKGYFGEQALFENGFRQRTVKAGCPTTCLVLGREVCTKILGEAKMKSIAQINSQKWSIENSEKLKTLSQAKKDKLIDRMKIKDGKNGQTLIKKNTRKRENIYFILEGNVFSQKGKKTFQKNHIIGDDFVFEKDDQSCYDDEYIFQMPTRYGEISYDALDEIMQDEETPGQEPHANEHPKLNAVQKDEILFQDLILLKKINQSNDSSPTTICIVKRKGCQDLYILKCISKYRAVENNRECNLKREKESLEIIKSPFFVEFVRTYKDDDNVYFLMKYIEGNVMSRYLRKLNKKKEMSTENAKLFIGQLILALEYIHSLYIIHRDLKPDNIIVQRNGYIKIIDMGISKWYTKDNWGTKTYTIIGTPHYMAPEIIKSKGYSFPVDYWSLGVIMYEIICGHLPFGEDKENDPYEIYEEIWKKEVKFPSKVTDKKAMRLMNQLLSKDPDTRIGGSFVVLRSDPWLDALDWGNLESQMKVFSQDLLIKDVEFELAPQDLQEENPRLIKDEIKNFSRPLIHNPKYMASKYQPLWDCDF